MYKLHGQVILKDKNKTEILLEQLPIYEPSRGKNNNVVSEQV